MQKYVTEQLPKHFGLLEKFAEQNGSNGHLVGNEITYPDIKTFSLVDSMQNIKADVVDAFPALKKLTETVAAVPAIHAYLHSADRPQPFRS